MRKVEALRHFLPLRIPPGLLPLRKLSNFLNYVPPDLPRLANPVRVLEWLWCFWEAKAWVLQELTEVGMVKTERWWRRLTHCNYSKFCDLFLNWGPDSGEWNTILARVYRQERSKEQALGPKKTLPPSAITPSQPHGGYVS
jgi:hypothetical protein